MRFGYNSHFALSSEASMPSFPNSSQSQLSVLSAMTGGALVLSFIRSDSVILNTASITRLQESGSFRLGRFGPISRVRRFGPIAVSLITPGHPRIPQDSIICMFNILYERVDDGLVDCWCIN